jgi:hypothetical protein
MLRDKARPHAAHATRDTLRRFGLGCSGSPPLWLSRVWALEEDSEGEVVCEAVEQWFIQQPVSFSAEGKTKFVQRWDNCLNSGCEYL